MNISWAELAQRIVRGMLARKGLRTGDLVPFLRKIDPTYSEESLPQIIARDRVSLQLFLQMLVAADDDIPMLWRAELLNEDGGWNGRSIRVVDVELREYTHQTKPEVAEEMVALGASRSAKTILARIDSGELSLQDFLLITYVIRSTTLSPYLDKKDVAAAAKFGRGEIKED